MLISEKKIEVKKKFMHYNNHTYFIKKSFKKFIIKVPSKSKIALNSAAD